MRTAYKVIAHLIAIGVVLESALIASQSDLGETLHEHVGMEVLPLFGLALLIVAFLAKIPGGAKWAGLTLLAILTQLLLADLAHGRSLVGALHGFNAFVILGAAEYAARQASLSEGAATSHSEAATV
jgi:membrane-bound ClpP family serine protease